MYGLLEQGVAPGRIMYTCVCMTVLGLQMVFRRCRRCWVAVGTLVKNKNYYTPSATVWNYTCVVST